MAKIEHAAVAELPSIPPLPKKRGRPATGKAKTNSERQAAWRKRQASGIDANAGAFNQTSDADLKQMIVEGGSRTSRMAWLELGRRNGWL